MQLGGGCQGCGMASVTLRDGVVRMIKEGVPEVEEVVDVTDHGAGENPYYYGVLDKCQTARAQTSVSRRLRY